MMVTAGTASVAGRNTVRPVSSAYFSKIWSGGALLNFKRCSACSVPPAASGLAAPGCCAVAAGEGGTAAASAGGTPAAGVWPAGLGTATTGAGGFVAAGTAGEGGNGRARLLVARRRRLVTLRCMARRISSIRLLALVERLVAGSAPGLPGVGAGAFVAMFSAAGGAPGGGDGLSWAVSRAAKRKGRRLAQMVFTVSLGWGVIGSKFTAWPPSGLLVWQRLALSGCSFENWPPVSSSPSVWFGWDPGAGPNLSLVSSNRLNPWRPGSRSVPRHRWD